MCPRIQAVDDQCHRLYIAKTIYSICLHTTLCLPSTHHWPQAGGHVISQGALNRDRIAAIVLDRAERISAELGWSQTSYPDPMSEAS